MATSGTYEFQSPQVEQIITDAYERVGIIRDLLTPQKGQAAQRSLNFILSCWPNRGLNLWTVKKEMMTLYPGQATYNLPLGTSDILEATVRTSTRNLDGEAFASSGDADNAFDGDPDTACTQGAPNGNIGYTWDDTQFSIALVGIQSNATLTYTLVFEFSNDDATWTQVLAAAAQTYTESTIVWFEIPVPTAGSYFRVRETGGATLNIQELYFNTSMNDFIMTPWSRSEWMSQLNKSQQGKPTQYWVDRSLTPTVTLWDVPDSNYNCLFYTRIQMPEDIGSLTNSPEVPSRFLEALTSELAAKLAIKEGKLDRTELLYSLADREFKLASKEDTERVPIRFYGNYSYGSISV